MHSVSRQNEPGIGAMLLRWIPGALVALAVVLVAAFVELSEELAEAPAAPQNHVGLDADVLRFAARLRRPWLNATAVDLTALGSPLLVALFTLVAAGLLLARSDRRGATLLLASSLASAILTAVLKGLLERPRPEIVPKLVHVTSLSYPSGHSLASAAVYLTAAMIVMRHLGNVAQRILALSFTVLVVLSVGASRVYLGVHYASDVLGGILLGTAWASFMAAALRRWDSSMPPLDADSHGNVTCMKDRSCV